MAERRMFAKSVTNSARFLMMPVSSRLLYYDLGMAADDEGIVEAFTVMRMSGAAEDDLRVLHSRGFITILTEEFVTYINDWKVNNYLQNDRTKPSRYHELLVKMQPLSGLETPCIQPVYNADTQCSVGECSIGENRLGEGSVREMDTQPDTAHTPGEGKTTPSLEEVKAFCREIKSTVDPAAFHSHYSSTGWTVNGKPIADWKAKLRYWDVEDRKKGKHTRPENMPSYTNEPDPLDGVF